jgi:hypothetical protein
MQAQLTPSTKHVDFDTILKYDLAPESRSS